MANTKKQSGKAKPIVSKLSYTPEAKSLDLDERFDRLLNEFREQQESKISKQKQKRGACKGQPCRGVGRGAHFVLADSCPSPCDETQYLETAADIARENALRAASVDCIRSIPGAKCQCTNGTYTFLFRECVPVEIRGTKYCAYDMYFEYVGECRDRTVV